MFVAVLIMIAAVLYTFIIVLVLFEKIYEEKIEYVSHEICGQWLEGTIVKITVNRIKPFLRNYRKHSQETYVNIIGYDNGLWLSDSWVNEKDGTQTWKYNIQLHNLFEIARMRNLYLTNRARQLKCE